MNWLIFLLTLFLPINVMALVDTNATTETEALYTQLQNAQGNYIYFGQETETDNGTPKVIKMGSKEKSECYLITGKFPTVWELDYWQIVNTTSPNPTWLTVIKNHYRQGGIITMYWSTPNMVTDGDTTDLTGDPVFNILPGGSARAKYLTKLDELATFLSLLKDDNNNSIPVIIRFYHECNGWWAWWQRTTCTDVQYIALWQDLVDYMNTTKGIHNIIWCYSPQYSCQSLPTYTQKDFTDRYPGDSYVDIIAADQYNDSVDTLITNEYEPLFDEANIRGKVFAIAEGFKNHIDDYPEVDYWTTYLTEPILANSKANKAAYLTCWGSPHWGPEVGRSDASSFLEMSQNSKIRMLTYKTFIRNARLRNCKIR